MSAWDTGLLLRCFATSEMAASGGYQSISFNAWRSLDGLLDNDVLKLLANAAPNASNFTFDQRSSFNVTSSLTSD